MPLLKPCCQSKEAVTIPYRFQCLLSLDFSHDILVDYDNSEVI